MDTTAQRYTSPATRPLLVSHPRTARPPLLCLHCAPTTGHTAHPLIGFDWGRVVTRR